MIRRFRFAVVALSLFATSTIAPTLKAQTWVLSYDRQVQSHGSVSAHPEQSRLVLTPKGDSVFGQLVKLATAEEPEWVIGEVRGSRRGSALTLHVLRPVKPMGFIATQWDALMAWLKETVHGISPTFIKLQLAVNGEEIRGTRTVVTIDGAAVDGPRPVVGRIEAR